MSDKEELATEPKPISTAGSAFVGVDAETSRQLEEIFAAEPVVETKTETPAEELAPDAVEQEKTDQLEEVLETKPVTQPETPPVKESEKLADYAEQIQQFSTREKEYKKKEKELADKLAKAEEFQRKFEEWQKDPSKLLDGLQEKGVTFDSLVNAQLNKVAGKDPKKEMEEQIAAKVAEVLKKRDEEQKTSEQQKQKEVQTKASAIIKDLVEKDSNTYKNLIEYPNYEQEVWSYIVQMNDKGTKLTFQDGCQQLENYLVSQYKLVAQRNGFLKEEGTQEKPSESKKGKSDVLPRDDAKIKTISSELEKPAPQTKETSQTGYKTWYDEIEEIAKMI